MGIAKLSSFRFVVLATLGLAVLADYAPAAEGHRQVPHLELAVGVQKTQPAVPTGSKPNIVFILVDNVGWGDFGGCQTIKGSTNGGES